MEAEDALIGKDEDAVRFEVQQKFRESIDGAFAEVDGHPAREGRSPGLYRCGLESRDSRRANVLGCLQLILHAQIPSPRIHAMGLLN